MVSGRCYALVTDEPPTRQTHHMIAWKSPCVISCSPVLCNNSGANFVLTSGLWRVLASDLLRTANAPIIGMTYGGGVVGRLGGVN